MELSHRTHHGILFPSWGGHGAAFLGLPFANPFPEGTVGYPDVAKEQLLA